MTISVIMLTYNREKLIARAIESIIAQTLRDFEFIIVNNGSNDASGDIADAYAKRDARIRVIHSKRGNIGSGRNQGLDAARGEYISFIDDDDWAEPDFLEFLHRLATENGADASICGSPDRTYDERIIMSAEEAVIALMWRKYYTTAFPTKMFSGKLMAGLRFPNDGCYDDIALMYKVLAKAGRVAYHGLPKYTFYRHDENNSAWTTDHGRITPAILDEYLGVYRERNAWLMELFPASVDTFRYFEWSFMISMVEKIHRHGLHDCQQQLQAMSHELRTNRAAFLSCDEILDFERDWLGKYIAPRADDGGISGQ